jgi:hypothetical protein
MHDLGINCCCAHTIGSIQTWTFALDLVGVNAQEARRAMAAAQAAQGQPGGFYGLRGGGIYGGGAWAAAAQDAAINEANRARELLVTSLNLPYEPPNPFLRACCGPCFTCQEVDSVIDFYQQNGYNVQYGNCFTLKCSNLYHNGRNLVPPRRLLPGQKWGIAQPVTVPDDAKGIYFYNGWAVPYDADGSPLLRNQDLRSREQADVITVSRGSADPSVSNLPLLVMDRA